MPRLVPLTGMCVLALTAYAADPLEAFLSTNAIEKATQAFRSGDRRYIVVPVCSSPGGEALPGWPLEGPTPPAFWKGLESGLRPFACDDLGEDPEAAKFMRLLRYAERYNRRLLELERTEP